MEANGSNKPISSRDLGRQLQKQIYSTNKTVLAQLKYKFRSIRNLLERNRDYFILHNVPPEDLEFMVEFSSSLHLAAEKDRQDMQTKFQQTVIALQEEPIVEYNSLHRDNQHDKHEVGDLLDAENPPSLEDALFPESKN
jgi:hypothetical protein